jgi:hypothetical protein
LTQEKITDLVSVGETATRLVLVFAQNPQPNPPTGTPSPGIYKVELDKNHPIANIHTIPLIRYRSMVVDPIFWNNVDIKLLSIGTNTNSDKIGIAYTIADTANPNRDILYSGTIEGDIYMHCPITPLTINGQISNIGCKFYTGGEVPVFFYNFKDSNNVDGLGWIGRH